MIQRSELVSIGTITKTHGLRGELSVDFDADFDAEAIGFVVLCIDGIYVPFRISSVRPRGTGGLFLSLDGIETADNAAQYVGHELFAFLHELPENDRNENDNNEGLYAEDLEGFSLTDPAGGTIGSILTVDTTTVNTLLHVELPDRRQVLVPLAEDWIVDLDPESRTISMDIPESLINETF